MAVKVADWGTEAGVDLVMAEWNCLRAAEKQWVDLHAGSSGASPVLQALRILDLAGGKAGIITECATQLLTLTV